MSVRIRNAEQGEVVVGRGPVDDELDAEGGAVMPGLHDHHIHVGALAAAASSVPVGPAEISGGREGLGAALRSAPGEWVRAVGYHESVAGPLDAAALDGLVPDRPVRVQHRTGVLWMLNSEALRRVGAADVREAGIERDGSGAPTGRLWRMDRWLGLRVPKTDLDVVAVGRAAAAMGVTGFTDADPIRAAGDLERLAMLPQRVVAMGPVGMLVPDHPRLARGPVKVLLDDDTLPPLDDMAALVEAAHGEGRAVAVHCVTRVQLVFALAAGLGSAAGDRIEHGSVIPDELIAELAASGIGVVTQPGFVFERGDEYLRDVDPDDRPHLYRCRSLLDAGVAVSLSTDAPYTSADPWTAMRAAVDRRTRSGEVIGPDEAVDAATALRMLQSAEPDDACVLASPLADVLESPHADAVRATIVAGRVVYSR